MSSFLWQFSDSSRAVISYLRKYGHLVLVKRLGRLSSNSVNRLLSDRLNIPLIELTGPLNPNTNKYPEGCYLASQG